MVQQAEMVDRFVPEGIELRLAYQLLSTEDGISRKALYELLGRPKRYSELKTVLPKGKSENSLTVALKTLRRNGLVDQRTDAREEPVVHRYEVTPLGIQVVLTMQRVQPLHEQLGLLDEALAVPSKEAGEGSPGPSGPGSGQSDVWHVTPHPAGGWRVKREGSRQASRVLETKKEALEAARELAVKRPGGRVAVHKKDGSFQRQITPRTAVT